LRVFKFKGVNNLTLEGGLLGTALVNFGGTGLAKIGSLGFYSSFLP